MVEAADWKHYNHNPDLELVIFWKALREVYGTTREQRCWVHKIEAYGAKYDKAVACLAKDRDVLLEVDGGRCI